MQTIAQETMRHLDGTVASLIKEHATKPSGRYPTKEGFVKDKMGFICRRIDQGKALAAIAKELGISPYTIYKHFPKLASPEYIAKNEANRKVTREAINKKAAKKEVAPLDMVKVESLLSLGLTAKKIASAMDITYNRLYKQIRADKKLHSYMIQNKNSDSARVQRIRHKQRKQEQ